MADHDPRAAALEPAAMLPLAATAVAVFGLLHLLLDIVAWEGDVTGQLGGILTDSHTIVTGVSLIVAFTAVARAPLPEAVAGWRVLAWTRSVREQPAAAMTRVLVILLAVGIAQTIVAVINTDDNSTTFLFVILSHDLFYMISVAAVVAVLATVAVRRSGAASWDRAPLVRDGLAAALYASPLLGLLLTILWYLELQDFDTRGALVASSFALTETFAMIVLLVVGNVVVRSLHPVGDDETERVALRGIVARTVDDPAPVLGRVVPATVVVGALHVLFAVGRGTDFSGRQGLLALTNSGFDVAAIIAVVLVVRAAGATYGPMNVVADGGSGDADGSADTDAGVRLATTLRTAVFVVAYLGVLSALVSAWAEYGDGAQIWYWVFNRLVRTAIGVGVLLGLQNLQHERTPVAA